MPRDWEKQAVVSLLRGKEVSLTHLQVALKLFSNAKAEILKANP